MHLYSPIINYDELKDYFLLHINTVTIVYLYNYKNYIYKYTSCPAQTDRRKECDRCHRWLHDDEGCRRVKDEKSELVIDYD